MKKVGDFWLPDVDVSWWGRWGKNRRKSLKQFGDGRGPKPDDLIEALQYVETKRVALDGGANVGSYTRIMLEHFETIYAFEPAPDTYEALVRNLEDWGVGDRVHVFQKALSDRDEKVDLGVGGGRRSLSRRIVGPGDVSTLRIDDLELPVLDFLKLDLEGYEVRAIRGAQQTLRRCRPVVLFEDKPHKSELYGEPGEAHRLLESLGARRLACIGRKRLDWVYGF